MSTQTTVAYKCGHTFETDYRHLKPGYEKDYGSYDCKDCSRQQAIATYAKIAAGPVESDFTDDELAHIEKAVEIAKGLGRPFTTREAFALARREGYKLSPGMDPKHRFVKHCGRVRNDPGLYGDAQTESKR
jgi:hypothetical protein